MKQKLVIVCGPTATGKTQLAVDIAKQYNGELINVDSRQIYKHLDIGTNKGKLDLISKDVDYGLSKDDIESLQYKKFKLPLYSIQDVPIHLMSFIDVNQKFSVFDYKILAEAVIRNIIGMGKLPVMVGGTGLYIDALLKNYIPVKRVTDSSIERELEGLDLSSLQDLLVDKNPQLFNSLNNSDRNNPYRLKRLIIKNASENNENNTNSSNKSDRLYDTIMLYKILPKNELEIRMKNRILEMLNEGIITETQSVLSMGYFKDSYGLTGIGYKQVIQYLKNEISYEQMFEDIYSATRQYAKRQRTWFEGEGRAYTLHRVSELKDVKEFL